MASLVSQVTLSLNVFAMQLDCPNNSQVTMTTYKCTSLRQDSSCFSTQRDALKGVYLCHEYARTGTWVRKENSGSHFESSIKSKKDRIRNTNRISLKGVVIVSGQYVER